MKANFVLRYASAALLATAMLCPAVRSDEGMWTFDNPPVKQLQERYQFTPTQQWLDHLRLASVRLNDGGSGSFVSAHGLLLTNHHVARGQLQKNSTADHDYIPEMVAKRLFNRRRRKIYKGKPTPFNQPIVAH